MFTKYYGTCLPEGFIGAIDVSLNILTEDKNVMI